MRKYIIIIIFMACCVLIFYAEKENKYLNTNLTNGIITGKLRYNIPLAKTKEMEENKILAIEKACINTKEKTIGILEIKKIKLRAEVKEGTSNEIIDKNIGHFTNTNIWFGNIGLCAHNNGYTNNHFAKLNELSIGDEVIYSTIYGKRNYIVSNILEIYDNDMSILQESKENKLTMITCITNKRNKRLCVQAIEKE